MFRNTLISPVITHVVLTNLLIYVKWNNILITLALFTFVERHDGIARHWKSVCKKCLIIFYLQEREPYYYSCESGLCTKCTGQPRLREASSAVRIRGRGVLGCADPWSQPLRGCADPRN